MTEELRQFMRGLKENYPGADVLAVVAPSVAVDKELYTSQPPCVLSAADLDNLRQLQHISNGIGYEFLIDASNIGTGTVMCRQCRRGCFDVFQGQKRSKKYSPDEIQQMMDTYANSVRYWIEQFLPEDCRGSVMEQFKAGYISDIRMLGLDLPIMAEQYLQTVQDIVVAEDPSDPYTIWQGIEMGTIVSEDRAKLNPEVSKKSALLAWIFQHSSKLTTGAAQALRIVPIIKNYSYRGEPQNKEYVSHRYMVGMFPALHEAGNPPFRTNLSPCLTHTPDGTSVVRVTDRNAFGVALDLEEILANAHLSLPKIDQTIFRILRDVTRSIQPSEYLYQVGEWKRLIAAQVELLNESAFDIQDISYLIGRIEQELQDPSGRVFEETIDEFKTVLRNYSRGLSKESVYRLIYLSNLRNAVEQTNRHMAQRVSATFDLQGLIFVMSKLGVSGEKIFPKDRQPTLRNDCMTRCQVERCPLKQGLRRKK